MNHENILTFLSKLLKNNYVHCHIIDETWIQSSDKLNQIDLGIRNFITQGSNDISFFKGLITQCKDNILYFITDCFYSGYTCCKLPGKSEYILVGPYTFEDIEDDLFFQLCDKMQIPPNSRPHFREYYNNISYIPYEAFFRTMLYTFADELWGDGNYEIAYVKEDLFIQKQDALYENNDIPLNYQLYENVYGIEKDLMEAVSQGNFQKAQALNNAMWHTHIEERINNPLRNRQNYLVVYNTLLRKAAEAGGIHPIQLHMISAQFARDIERLTKVNDVERLALEMTRSYSNTVKDHSLSDYSPLVQRVIIQISCDLSSNLSLKSLSEAISVNASYLSTLFKRETGHTLTDYVNSKRIDYACHLLRTTNLQIQTIAAKCGIYDLNYFTKLFKKTQNITPSEYRSQIDSMHKQRTKK